MEMDYLNNLKNFREQLEIFINAIPGCVYWKDKNGVYFGCNNTLLTKGQLSSKEAIVGKTDIDIWRASAEEIRKNDLAVMQQDKTMEVEETILLQSGELLYFSSVKSPLKDEDGHIIGIIGNSLDITELKQAKQHAEAASLAKTQFLALMSHELRIPLTGILSAASIMSSEDLTVEESQEFAQLIESSGQYLLSSIDNILDFAKLEADKFQISSIGVNLQDVINEVTGLLAKSAKQKGLSLFVHLSVNPPIIMTDPRVLRHIFANLISNAVKYTEHGSIDVTVKTKYLINGLIQLDLTVTDTGIGIPANKLDYIFDRFSQVESGYTRKNSRQGSGLGLSIVKKLTQLLHGDIHVTSQLGIGSSFHFAAVFQSADQPRFKVARKRLPEFEAL